MTIKEIASEQKITPTRLMQLIEEIPLVKDIDYSESTFSFSETGIEKIRNRNKKKGRPFGKKGGEGELITN